MFKFFSILLSIFLFASCSQTSVQETSLQKHINESEQLQYIMHSLKSSIYEKNKSELDIEDAKKRYALKIALNIKQATNVLNKYGESNLKDESLKSFLSLNQKLEVYSSKIESIANNYEIEKLDDEIEQMELICTSCHVQFRGYR